MGGQEEVRSKPRVLLGKPLCGYARSTSLIGSRTSPLSKRTQTSHSQTLITEPMAPAGMLTGGSSALFNRTLSPTSKPFSTVGTV